MEIDELSMFVGMQVALNTSRSAEVFPREKNVIGFGWHGFSLGAVFGLGRRKAGFAFESRYGKSPCF